MLKQFKRWSAAPVFEGDQEKTWRASLIHVAIVTCVLVVLLIVSGNLIGGKTPVAVFTIDGVMLVVLLLIRSVLMRGRVSLAGGLLTVFGIGLITLASASLGTIRTPTTAFLILIVIVAGLSFGKIGLVSSAALSSLAVLGLVFAENAGILPRPDTSVTVTQWISYTVAFVLTGMLTNFAYESMQKALDHAFSEMSERKQAEEALRLSESRLKEAERIALLGHWELDIPQNKLHWSDDIYRIFEMPPTQVESSLDDFLNRVHPDDRDMVEKAYAESLEFKTPYRIDHRIILRDGKVKYVHAQGENFYDAHGNAIRSIGTIQDITERKMAEEQLRKLSRAVESAPVVIVITDKNGNIEYANPFFSTIAGYDTSEALGKNPSILQSGLTPPETYRQLWQTIKHGQTWEGEFVNRKKDGDLYTEQARISPIFDARDNITHFVAIKQDITQQKMIEEALRASETLFRAITEQSGEGICLLDDDGNFVIINPAFCQMTGYSEAELLSMEVLDLLPENTDPSLFLKVRSGQSGRSEVYLKKKDGSLFWSEIKGDPIQLGDRNMGLGVVRDITERKRLQAELERLATTDPLTGVYNRREFARLAEIELERAHRHDRPISVIMLDADHFKNVNDTYGHAAGDRVLVALAQLLTREVRASDLVARYGGEEFMLLLPETSLEQACVTAERIRRAVADTPVMVDEQTIRFTISLGVTSSDKSGLDFESLLKDADRLLYHAKEAGRNRVTSPG